MHPETTLTESTLDEAVAVFVELRPRLFGIAYRVLGSAVEAEDVVQETWLRWQRTDRSVAVSPMAFLSSTTTRPAINVAQSARVRRETYIGPWPPEPVDTSSDPEVGAQRAEALELALLLVLEKLNPTERAAYVLREAFDVAYSDGRSGVLLYRDGRPTTFMTIAASQAGIHQVMWVFNPSKIAAFLDSGSRRTMALGA